MLNARQFAGGAAVSALLAVAAVGTGLSVAAIAEEAKPAKSRTQQKPKTAAQKPAESAPKRDPAAAERAYAAGVRAFEANKLTEAVQQLSAALANGGLANPQMAKALYYRGLAYRQEGKPAQAIADLTTAAWLRGGLAEPEKSKAIEARKLAYQEAGLGEAPPIGTPPLDSATKTASAPAAQPQPKPGAQVATAPPAGSFWNPLSALPSVSLFGGSSSQPAQQAPQAAPPQPQAVAPAPTPEAQAVAVGGPPAADAPVGPPPQPVVSSWDVGTAVAPAEVPAAGFAQTSAAPSPVPAPAQSIALAPAEPQAPSTVTNPLAGAGSAISGFFGNMFGQSSTAAQQATLTPSSGVTTGSTGAASAPDASQPVNGTGWGEPTVAAAGPVQTPPAAQSDGGALPWAGKTAALPPQVNGKYRLQVAAVRSREEAERVAQGLYALPELQGGTVRAEVDEAVYGSMGTFYRVRLGPYADAIAPNQLCKTLRPQGFDCLVVAQ